MAACRTRAEVAALREAVLDAWAAGDRLAAIAAGLGVTVSTVTRELRERRQRRDPRAAFRYRCAGSQRAKAAARLLAPPRRPARPQAPVRARGHPRRVGGRAGGARDRGHRRQRDVHLLVRRPPRPGRGYARAPPCSWPPTSARPSASPGTATRSRASTATKGGPLR